MTLIFLGLTIKDWIIVIALLILILCILEIRKLKRRIAAEIQKRILPQLILEFNIDADAYPDNSGFYLKNESCFIARDIQFEDIELALDDLGYKLHPILKFEDIDYIKPQEKIKLKFKVFDRNQNFLPEVTETIIPHLTEASFKIKICYSNIENLKIYIAFFKKGRKIITEALNPAE